MNDLIEAYATEVESLMDIAVENLDGFTVEFTHLGLDDCEAGLPRRYELSDEENARIDEVLFELMFYHTDLESIARPNIRYIDKDLGDASKAIEQMIRRLHKFLGYPGVTYRRRSKV